MYFVAEREYRKEIIFSCIEICTKKHNTCF
jgi:hypothetical protein